MDSDSLINLSDGSVTLQKIGSTSENHCEEPANELLVCNAIKQKGNTHFVAKEYGEALKWYEICLPYLEKLRKRCEDKVTQTPLLFDDEYVTVLETSAKVYFNRAACFMKMANPDNSYALMAQVECGTAITEFLIQLPQPDPVLLEKSRYRYIQCTTAVIKNNRSAIDVEYLKGTAITASLQMTNGSMKRKLLSDLQKAIDGGASPVAATTTSAVAGESRAHKSSTKKSAAPNVDCGAKKCSGSNEYSAGSKRYNFDIMDLNSELAAVVRSRLKNTNLKLAVVGKSKGRGLVSTTSMKRGDLVLSDNALAFFNVKSAYGQSLLGRSQHILESVPGSKTALTADVVALAIEVIRALYGDELEGDVFKGDACVVMYLQSHIETLKKDDRPKYELVCKVAERLVGINPSPRCQFTRDPEIIARVLLATTFNGFTVRPELQRRGSGGLALFPVASFLNHDANPNVGFVFSQCGKVIHCRALQDIAPGEDLVISYVDPYLCDSDCKQQLASLLVFRGNDGDTSTRCSSYHLPQPESLKHLLSDRTSLDYMFHTALRAVINCRDSAKPSSCAFLRATVSLMELVVTCGDKFPVQLENMYVALDVCLYVLGEVAVRTLDGFGSYKQLAIRARYKCAGAAIYLMEKMVPAPSMKLAHMYADLSMSISDIIRYTNPSSEEVKQLKAINSKAAKATQMLDKFFFGPQNN